MPQAFSLFLKKPMTISVGVSWILQCREVRCLETGYRNVYIWKKVTWGGGVDATFIFNLYVGRGNLVPSCIHAIVLSWSWWWLVCWSIVLKQETRKLSLTRPVSYVSILGIDGHPRSSQSVGHLVRLWWGEGNWINNRIISWTSIPRKGVVQT